MIYCDIGRFKTLYYLGHLNGLIVGLIPEIHCYFQQTYNLDDIVI